MHTPSTTDQHHLHVLRRLFEELENDALIKILEAGTKHQIAPGEYLFRQGDQDNTLFIEYYGKV